MDVSEISTSTSELHTSTESDFNVVLQGIYDYMTTMNPLDFHAADKVPKTIDGHDGVYVFYGLGGILIFFAIYMLIYSYLLHCKEAEERRESEIRETYERVSYRPMQRDRIFIEDFNHAGSQNLAMPLASDDGSSNERNPESFDVETGELKTRIIDLPQAHLRNGREIPKRNGLSQDSTCPNTTVKEICETSGAVAQNTNTETLGRVESWMSEPPLCYSTPQDSNERIYFPEDFQDLLCPTLAQMQKCEILTECTSDVGNVTSDCSEKLPLTTPDKLDADNTTPTKVGENLSPSPKRKSRSSPSTPEIVRRRVATQEDKSPRPSSWQ